MNKMEVQKRLKEIGIYSKKSLGQNFLINSALLYKMIFSIKNLCPKKIIEVGPGLGSLTELLSQINIPLLLIELDKNLCRFWRKRNFSVVEGNVLLKGKYFDEICCLVGNLPYQIASRLVIQASLEWEKIESMVIMLQKEVAERILSSSKFSLLSVTVQCLWDVEFLAEAKVTDFYPSPKVKGWILVFKRKPKPNIDVKDFFNFLKICFIQKRKFLKKKLLRNYGKNVENIFKKMNFSEKIRSEEIFPSQFIKMYKLFNEK